MNLPNYLTLLRILLCAAFVTSLIYYTPERAYFACAALALFVTACVTDAVDGFLARRFNQKTALGSALDPIADKLLLLSGFVSLSYLTNLPEAMRIPPWVTITVITRDVLITIGAGALFLSTGKLKIEPLFVGKLTTVSQMLALFLCLVSAPEAARTAALAGCVGLTVLSGAFYVRMAGRMLG